MTTKEKARELVRKYWNLGDINVLEAKKYALIAVDYIINSNPHSNPFNTDVFSTILYWQEVKQEIEKI